jgi:NAD(P)-dependent dehydrogenase (short-subunit alcohol dehydrogenase family)
MEQTPIGRAATVEELASVVRFVMSEEASYVNGVALPVDGGLTA